MSIPKIAAYPLPGAQDCPPPRVDWRPDPARCVLLVHDMQDYFVNFFDRSAAPVPELLANIARLRTACRQVGVPVVYTAQPPEQSLPHRGLLQDWWGPGITARPDEAAVVADLAPSHDETVLTKWRYSAFARTGLAERMQAWGRDQLLVCGVYAHIGVMTTCVDAFMRDIQPFLAADAVADFSRQEHLDAMRWVAGRCGVVDTSEQFVRALSPAVAAPPGPHQSPQALLEEVAALLDMPAAELRADDNLVDMGLDSIRLMDLVTRWRRAGLTVDFSALAAQTSVQAWWQVLYAEEGAPA